MSIPHSTLPSMDWSNQQAWKIFAGLFAGAITFTAGLALNGAILQTIRNTSARSTGEAVTSFDESEEGQKWAYAIIIMGIAIGLLMIIALGTWYIGNDLVECTPATCPQRLTPVRPIVNPLKA